MGTKKKARSEERKRVFFFVFWRERFVCCFAQKHTDMNHHVLCKGGGRGVQLAFAAFTSSNDDNVSTTRTIITTTAKKRAHDDAM